MLCLYLLTRIVCILLFNHIKAVKHTPVIIRNCQIKLSMHSKILQKPDFIEKVGPENFALFFNVSTRYFKTVN